LFIFKPYTTIIIFFSYLKARNILNLVWTSIKIKFSYMNMSRTHLIHCLWCMQNNLINSFDAANLSPKSNFRGRKYGSITTWKEKEIDFTMIIKKTCIKGRRLEASLNSCEGYRVYQEYWTQWGQTLSILILKFVFAAWRWKASNYHGVDKYWDKKTYQHGSNGGWIP
jgi:hypothetical protein